MAEIWRAPRRTGSICCIICSNGFGSPIISHFSLVFLAASLLRFCQLSALRRTLSTGNLCRIRTVSGVHRTLEESSRDLSLFMFKYGAVVLFVVLGLLNSLFKGKAVAKLLFKPFGFVMKNDEDEPQRAARGGSDTLFDALSLINW